MSDGRCERIYVAASWRSKISNKYSKAILAKKKRNYYVKNQYFLVQKDVMRDMSYNLLVRGEETPQEPGRIKIPSENDEEVEGWTRKREDEKRTEVIQLL